MGEQASSSARDAAFESCATPVIDAIFSLRIAVEAHEFATVPTGLEGAWRRGRSACGVLVRCCVGAADLAEWAHASQAARFDGQVAPMARPGTGFGAGLFVLVRRCEDLSTSRWAFVQLKSAKDADLAEALRTVDPELLLLHTGRDLAPAQQDDFDKVYVAMFGTQLENEGRSRPPAFRVLVNLHPTGPGGKHSIKKRAIPKAVADVAKKCKTDAMIYLGRDDAIAAVAEPIGEAAVGYITTMSGESNTTE
jgi:hypothetical protein